MRLLVPVPAALDDIYEALRARLRIPHVEEETTSMPGPRVRHHSNPGNDGDSNREEVAVVVAGLLDVYPRADFSEDNVDAYVELLADLPAGELRIAARAWAIEHQFPPSVAELRAIVVERRVGLPAAMVAWENVERAIRDDPEGDAVRALPLEVRAALKMIGGSYALKTSQRPELFRRDFIQAYDLLRAQSLRDVNFTSAGLPVPLPLLELEAGEEERE